MFYLYILWKSGSVNNTMLNQMRVLKNHVIVNQWSTSLNTWVSNRPLNRLFASSVLLSFSNFKARMYSEIAIVSYEKQNSNIC